MSSTKKEIITNKLRGGYYTPHRIADFLCHWAIRKIDDKILEPSCGDGVFIESGMNRLLELGLSPEKLNGQLTGIELIGEEAQKARNRIQHFGIPGSAIKNQDFFSFVYEKFQKDGMGSFDAIVGNPPFIRYQNFSEEHRQKAMALMKMRGLHPNKLTNIWVPFLVISSTLLNDNGRLAMVIPAELFQVKYAAETRVFLSNFFEHITIITFKKLVFDTIQQEVVLLLCEKKNNKAEGIRLLEFDGIEDLTVESLNSIYNTDVKTIDHDNEKWTKYFLNQSEIDLLREIRNRSDIRKAEVYLDVDVGIVTGRNQFFMLNEEQVKKWELEEFTQRVVGRSPHLKGITFSETDFERNLSAGSTCLLFIPPNLPFEELPAECKKYIEYGESQKSHLGYKCRIRKRWYITPSIWVPEAFALRQINDFPKLILNENGASATDTIHRVRFKTDHNRKFIITSFLNSLTFAFSEITGRSYGGGVMTFEPTEIEELPLPVLTKSNLDFNLIDKLMRKKEVEKILDLVDKELLIDQYHFKISEVKTLRGIWMKLSQRRSARKKR